MQLPFSILDGFASPTEANKYCPNHKKSIMKKLQFKLLPYLDCALALQHLHWKTIKRQKLKFSSLCLKQGLNILFWTSFYILNYILT